MTEQDLNSELSVSRATVTAWEGPELECMALEFRRDRSCHSLPLPAQIPLFNFRLQQLKPLPWETTPLFHCLHVVQMVLTSHSWDVHVGQTNLARLFHPSGLEMVMRLQLYYWDSSLWLLLQQYGKRSYFPLCPGTLKVTIWKAIFPGNKGNKKESTAKRWRKANSW